MKSDRNSDLYYLTICRKLVEDKLGWGSSDAWSHADFVEASEKISEEAGIQISVTTIKRIWGKVKYSGTPATVTLNALAAYIGYKNWRDFKINQEVLNEIQEGETENSQPQLNTRHPINLRQHAPKRRNRKNLFVPFLSALALLLVALYFLSGKEKDTDAYASDDILFNSEPVTTGLPNTVIFNYDISALKFDSAFIQQNWDARRRQKIDRQNKQMTSVYYYPGHFHAKLVLNDKVVKEHGLLIPTEGWLGIIDREGYNFPEYILPGQLIERKSLHATPEVLLQKKVDSRNDFQLTYSNAKDFGVDGDNFILETSIKNDLAEGGLICQESGFLLDGETGIVVVPLSAPGCVGNLGLQFGDVYVNGKTNDLSFLGADLSQWNDIKYVVKDKKAEVFVNEKLVYSVAYQEPVGKIMGINFKFHGSGAVDYIRLRDKDGKIIYEDDF